MNPKEYEAAAALAEMSAQMPCTYCRKPMVQGHSQLQPTRDHIWPKVMRSMEGGRTGKVWCCAKCNFEKGDMMPSEWLARLKSK